MKGSAASPRSSGKREGLRRHLRWAFIMAATAIVMAVLLLPRGDELLLIHVRNHDVVRARAVLAAGADVGVSTTASVVAHGELYLFEGRVDEALGDMEGYVEAHPDDREAWSHLATLYRNAQRVHDWTRALGEVYRLAPSEALARELVTRFRRAGDEQAEARMLQDLVATGHARVEEYVRSVRLEAALGRHDAARDGLEQLRRREPRAFDYPAMELYASLLIEAGQTDALARHFQTLPLVREEPHLLADLAGALRNWGEVDAALALLTPLPDLPSSPALLAALARTAVGTDAAGRVAKEMASVDASHPLSPEPLAAFVSLALSLADYDEVERVLANHAGDSDPDLVAAAIGHAATGGARARAQRFVARFGDDALYDSPMLALELAVERDDGPAAERWIAFVDATGQATPEQVAALAQFESTLGHDTRAFDRLLSLAKSGEAPVWSLTDLTTMAARLGRVNEVLAAFEPLASRSPDIRGAWVRLAASTGRIDLIDAWLSDGAAPATDAPALRDAYYLLADRQESRLATEAARRLYVAAGGSDEALVFGQALLAAGKPFEALAPLRRVRDGNADAILAYDGALYAAQAAGHDVTSELQAVFEARLREDGLADAHRAMLVDGLWQSGERVSLFDDVLILARQDLDTWLSPLVESARATGGAEPAIALVAEALGAAARSDTALERRELLLFALLDLEAPDEAVLPSLERLAYDAGAGWVPAYDERLARAGRTSDRIDFWTAVGGSTGASLEDQRAAALRLHDLGATGRAADIGQRLAAAAGPADPDVDLLLYFWGPRPSNAQRAWLVSRLDDATVAEQAAWMTHLVNVGGARDVVEAVPVLPDSASPAFVDAWVNAHRAVPDRGALRSAIEMVVGRGSVTDAELRSVGRVALAEGLNDLASRAFQEVAERHPTDLEATRWLGTLAFYRGAAARAGEWLTAYRAAGGDEPEPLFQLGELALGRREKNRARQYFTLARDRLTGPTPGLANPGLLANVFVRLGERQQASTVFDGLLAADPELDHVRADYVSALFEWGDHTRADDVLDVGRTSVESPEERAKITRAPTPVSETAPDVSGARRLDLLRVQRLTFRGRYPAALQLLDQLASRFPSDPDVLVARGVFDAERGRSAQADMSYQAARVHAPERDDIGRLLDDRRRLKSPRVELQTSGRSVRDSWDERTTKAAFEGFVTPRLQFTMSVERLHLTAPSLLQADGVARPVDVDTRRFEASVAAPVAVGTTMTAVVFGSGGGAGAGATLTRHDLYGASSVTVERGRPFWEFPESAADDGRRDRVGVQRQLRLGADTSAWVLANWNRYRLASGAALSSAAFGFGVVKTVRRRQPTLTLQYGLDVEHRRGATVAIAADGRPFTPIPLSSREVHVAGAISRFKAAVWDVETAVGYTVDRLGGRGSFLTARMTPPAGSRVGVDIWVERRLFSIATTQRVLQAGAALKVRF